MNSIPLMGNFEDRNSLILSSVFYTTHPSSSLWDIKGYISESLRREGQGLQVAWLLGGYDLALSF